MDVVVLGAGPAGEVCAGRLAAGGLEVVLVESHLVGGECSYYACMPSKALLRPGELAAEARRIPGVREACGGELDVPAVLARRDAVVHGLDDAAQLPWLEQRRVALVRGHGELAGERRVRVADELFAARRAVVVATGSVTSPPPLEGLPEAGAWTNREATTASGPPGRLTILGGGAVGVELAQAWSTLGTEVTLVEAGDRLLASEEPFVGEQVRESLRERGVGLLLAATATRVDAADGGVTLQLEGHAPVQSDELLVATGRRPATAGIGLERLGLDPGAPLAVDDSMRVPGHDWLWAVGDVNGRAQLTHVGKYQGRVAAAAILGEPGATVVDGVPPPRVIFTDPQAAAVGHTLATARAAGVEARAVDAPTQGSAGARFYGRRSPGTARIVVDERRDLLVGATFSGPEVAELLHAATVAVVAEVPLGRLGHAIPAFPTRSEIWLDLLEQLRCG